MRGQAGPDRHYNDAMLALRYVSLLALVVWVGGLVALGAIAAPVTFDVIAARVAAGDEVSIGGFGKFTVAERSARTGRNPQTGETMQIAASKAPKFSAASAFKTAVKD